MNAVAVGAKTRSRLTNGLKTDRSSWRARAGRASAGGEFLHDDGAQKRKRERPLKKAKERSLGGGVAKRVNEDVGIECELHARSRDSNTSSIPPTRRMAVMP